jgi:hypothetical protein
MKADKFTLIGTGVALFGIIAAFALMLKGKKASDQDSEIQNDHMAKMRAAKAAKAKQKTEVVQNGNETNSDTNETTEQKD